MISASGFPEITNFERFVESCNMHYFNYQEECRRRPVDSMNEQDFEGFFRTIGGEDFERMFLALRLRRFVEVNEGNVIRLMDDYVNPTTHLDEESKSFANWLLKRFKTVDNIR